MACRIARQHSPVLAAMHVGHEQHEIDTRVVGWGEHSNMVAAAVIMVNQPPGCCAAVIVAAGHCLLAAEKARQKNEECRCDSRRGNRPSRMCREQNQLFLPAAGKQQFTSTLMLAQGP